MIRTHLFEDCIMKSSCVRAGDECTVGNMAAMLYDAEMKREILKKELRKDIAEKLSAVRY